MTFPLLSRPCLCKHRRGAHRMATTTACDLCECKGYKRDGRYRRCPTCDGRGVASVPR